MSRLLNKTLYVRTLSGIALLIVVLGTVLWSPYSMLALGVFLTAGIMREFYRIGRLTGARPLTTYPIVVGAGDRRSRFPDKNGYACAGLPRSDASARLRPVHRRTLSQTAVAADEHRMGNRRDRLCGGTDGAVRDPSGRRPRRGDRLFAGRPAEHPVYRLGQRRGRLSVRRGVRTAPNCSSASPRTNRGKDSSAG